MRNDLQSLADFFFFFLQNYCKSLSNSYNSSYLDLICLTVQRNEAANYTGTVHKLQAGRFKSDKRKDEDQYPDFSKEQGENFFFYHGFADLLRPILCPNLEIRTPLSILT